MSVEIIQHPTATAAYLRTERLRWMREAARFDAKDEYTNSRCCQSRAAGLNDAIVALGGEGISLRVSDYAEDVA